MKCDMDAPYIFGALEGNMCNVCTCANENELARAFVMKQHYGNITDPATALQAGTIFCDLYKPYDSQRNCY